jgi:hypothetical protein
LHVMMSRWIALAGFRGRLGVGLAIVCGVAAVAPVRAKDRLVDTERSTVTVRTSVVAVAGALSDDHVIQAPLSEGTFDDAIPHLQIVIDARRLRVVDPGRAAKDRQEVLARMLGPDVLDVKRYQWITFHSITIERQPKGGWLVNGELELHGNIRPLPLRVVRENGRYKGSVTVRQSDYGIVPLSLAGGAIKVKDEVTIDFDILVTDQFAFQ